MSISKSLVHMAFSLAKYDVFFFVWLVFLRRLHFAQTIIPVQAIAHEIIAFLLSDTDLHYLQKMQSVLFGLN